VLLEIASECCGGRILFSLEGGYDLDGLRDGVLAVLLEAIGRTVLDEKNLQRLSKAMAGPQALEQAVEFQKKYWPCLA